MRYELEKFFSNPCESSGLLIAEAPTGYGKTYETIQAIYRYIEKGGKSQILFITNHKVIFDYLFKSSYMPV